MISCRGYEMQFLKCFGSVQVASIFILDELGFNMAFSSSFPDGKIEYHWPSWTVSVSRNCHLLLKILRWKIIEQLSQLLPLLLFTVCATVIQRHKLKESTILLDIAKMYNRSFPRELRVSVDWGGGTEKIERWSRQVAVQEMETFILFCLIFKLQFVIPSKSTFLLLFKKHFVYCLSVQHFYVLLLLFFYFLSLLSIASSENYFLKIINCIITFNLSSLGFYINSWTSIYTSSLRKSVFVVPLLYKVFSFAYCF